MPKVARWILSFAMFSAACLPSLVLENVIRAQPSYYDFGHET